MPHKRIGAILTPRSCLGFVKGETPQRPSAPEDKSPQLTSGKFAGHMREARFWGWVSLPTLTLSGLPARAFCLTAELITCGTSPSTTPTWASGGIGMATRTDGINWKRADNGKPVLSVGPEVAFDESQVMGSEVDFDRHFYRMRYTGMASKWGASGLG